jgi:hypothetical protein
MTTQQQPSEATLLQDAVAVALAEIASAIRPSHFDVNAGLAELIGSRELYNGLMIASEDFIRLHPNLAKNRIASEYAVGLWIGLVAGIRAGKAVASGEVRYGQSPE